MNHKMTCVGECQQNGELGSSKVSFPQRNMKKNEKLSELCRSLEINQKFIETKQMHKQEKLIFKMLGKFCNIFTCTCPTSFLMRQ